jgi:hypothetical protein
MGHRALCAFERGDGTYTCFYSHWGAHKLRLRNDITPDEPLGGDYSEPAFVNALTAALSNAADESDMELAGKAAEANERTDVDPDPVAVGVTLHEAVHEHLDFLHHEAFYVVDQDFDVTAYRTLWFGMKYEVEQPNDPDVKVRHDEDELPGHHETVGNGALVTVRWYNDEPVGDGHTKGRFSELKSVVADVIDRDMFLIEEGQEYMAEKVIDDISQGHNSHKKRGELFITDQHATGHRLYAVPEGTDVEI